MNRNISAFFEERPDLNAQLESCHPVRSAALVAGLLTEPSFHANTLRIETLVQLLAAFGEGDKAPSLSQISTWLNTDLGSTRCARLEDPVEDVFISNVTTETGNTRIFEGLWESNDFGLQRILNVVATLPDDQHVRRLRKEISAALKLSEEIASRRHLGRFSSGAGVAKGRIELPSSERLKSLSRTLEFSVEDFQELEVSLVDLEVFILKADLRERLRNQAWGDSELERCPIVEDEGKYFLLLPAAMSVAIRRHVLEWMRSRGYEESFDHQLVGEYSSFLRGVPILGPPFPRRMPLPSLQAGGKNLLQFSTSVDTGRYLQVIAVVDGIAGYLNYGFSSPEQDVSELSDEIDRLIKDARSYFRKQDGFVQGLTLLVSCGYGRPMVFELAREEPDWWIESVSAPDLEALSWAPGKQELFP